MKVALYGRSPKQDDIIYVQKLISEIEQRNSYVIIHKSFYEKIKDKISFSKPYKTFTNKEDLEEGVDIIFSLGGDGTLLDTLPIMGNSEIPILGINIGHLGFLTSVGREGISNLLEELEAKNYNIGNRSILKVDDKNVEIKDKYALNDICLRSAKAGELLDISIFIDDEFLATYTADGVIVTTPTGSTAYNMSAGGPIISPQSPCIGITPICPHNLTFRPIIISDTSNIRLEVNESFEEIIIYIDSQCTTVNAPFTVDIKKAEFNVKLIRMDTQSFFDAIRKKLMWGTYIRRG
ncbi:MAG: NAD kinase [Bacteroidales bacterium]|nr:NAD kinase [Bacteroidales bacterium]